MASVDTALPETSKVVRAGIKRGFHTGLQLYVSCGSEVIADCGFGESSPGVEMTPQAITMWLSAGKPLTAVAILQLVEEGLLDLDRQIVDWIPEFATGGKEEIRLHHLLTHTAGFRNIETGWPLLSWDETIDRICESPLEDDWQIGETAGYHTSSSWFILGELIQRVDPHGRDCSTYFRDEICMPLGMTDSSNGMTPESWSTNRVRIAGISQLEKGRINLLPWHDKQHCIAASPGAGFRGPCRELGRFYECLLAGGEVNGRQVLNDESVELLTTRHREGLYDQTLFHKVDFGLGVIVDSNRYGADTVPYGFGPYCSERTFGHGGSQSSIGFADPDAELVVCYVANCRIGEPRHQQRNREIISAIYRDLGLANV